MAHNLTKTYALHRDHNGPALTPRQVRKAAEIAGFTPGKAKQMAQIARGESSFQPGIVSSDGGYGLWQMTPRVWGEAAKQKLRELGGIEAMGNPVKNAKMAKYLYDNAGGTFQPWFGTKYLDRNMDTSSVKSVLKGGEMTAGKPGKVDPGVPPSMVPGETKQDIAGALTDALLMGRDRKGQSLLQAALGLLETGQYTTTTPTTIDPGRPASFKPGEKPEALKDGGGGKGKHINLKPHGGWGGSEGALKNLIRAAGGDALSLTSSKRDNQNPYSGSRSDHDYGNKSAYAEDRSNGGAPTPEMDRYAYRLMHKLGFKDYKLGTPINTSQGKKVIDGIQYQVIYRGSGEAYGGNHLNHVHVGAHRVG